MVRESVPMRKQSRKMQSEEEVDGLLREALVGRLGTCHGNEPYVVPVNYAYLNGKIYLHSAPEGKKIRNIRANPLVCFEVDEMGPIIARSKACDYGTVYRSAIVYGTVRSVDDPATKRLALEALMQKYVPEGGYPPITDRDVDTTPVWEIEIEEKVGKHAGKPQA